MKTTRCDRIGSLVTRTKTLVNEHPEGLVSLSHNAGVPFWWLRKFASGQIPAPGANRVQYLYEYLTGRPLLK